MASSSEFQHVPLVDVSAFLPGAHASDADKAAAAERVHAACRDVGFMYITGHGVPSDLVASLEALARAFFALPLSEKQHVRMALGGRAWRGYFPPEDELTSGVPDLKEGLYFGDELDPSHPLVQANTPMHGRNLFPAAPSELRATVLRYMDAMRQLGHAVCRGVALGLGLPETYFQDGMCAEPLGLFRIFNYPDDPRVHAPDRWGVGEHTDYGLITLLFQDASGGLEVRNLNDQWISAPPIPDTFVVNLGDMLERMTGGLYRSTPHRVRNTAGRDRVSFPFFFDPGWNAAVHPIRLPDAAARELVQVQQQRAKTQRWDHTDLLAADTLTGTYGQYLLGKVGKVFPDLAASVSTSSASAAAVVAESDPVDGASMPAPAPVAAVTSGTLM